MKSSHLRSFAATALMGLLVAPAAMAQGVEGTNPRPGQEGHREHIEWQGDYASPEAYDDFRVLRTFAPPEGFLGNLTYDLESQRLFLVSLGPPTNEGSSMLYELNPKNGAILAQAAMPFQGDFGEPVFLDGHLYQGVFHESKLYKVAVDGKSFGKVLGSIDLPTINDLNLVEEAHSYPFIEFGGVTATPDGNLMIHADDVGEYIKIDKESGKILARSRTIKAMGGITGVASLDKGNPFFVLANSDPRGGYCALSYPPLLSRSPEQKDISWALTDGHTGEVLASLRRQGSRAYAGTVSLTGHEKVADSPFGRFTFFATGEEGILEIEWTPGREAASR